MNDEIIASIEHSRKPLMRVREKQQVEEISKVAETGPSPEVRLRAALSIGMSPPEQLLEPTVISRALSLEDCWKFFTQMSSQTRTLEAGPVLEAIRRLLSEREKVNLGGTVARLLRLSERWQGTRNTIVPSAITVANLLNLVETILTRRFPKRTEKSTKQAPPPNPVAVLLETASQWTISRPTVQNLVVIVRCFNVAERRQGLRLAVLLDDRSALAEKVSSVRNLLIDELERSAIRAEIDNFRILLLAVREFPVNRSEMEQAVPTARQSDPCHDER
jgi:hypothetical protein